MIIIFLFLHNLFAKNNEIIINVVKFEEKVKINTLRAQESRLRKNTKIIFLNLNLDLNLFLLVSCLEYYVDESNKDHYFISTYNNNKSGQIIISHSESMTGKVYELDNGSHNISGTTITVPIVDYLEVIELQLNGSTPVDNINSADLEFINLKNNPNPFNAETKIHYQLISAAYVKLTVYNLLGEKIRTLVSRQQQAGNYRIAWDGKNLLNQAVSSGTYFCRLELGSLSNTISMLLLR